MTKTVKTNKKNKSFQNLLLKVLKWGLIVFASLVTFIIFLNIWSLVDPNFVEYGPQLTFITNDCPKFQENCGNYGGSVLSNWKYFPSTLKESMQWQLNKLPLSEEQQDPEHWECMVDGKIIEDINEQLVVHYGKNQPQVHYNCWLK